MGRPRFSLAGMLGLLAACGVAFAAMRSPSNLWANALVTAALAALVIALINLRYSRDGRRAYWLGFALCGWIYFAASYSDILGPRLLTTAMLDLLYPQVAPPSLPTPMVVFLPSPPGGGSTVVTSQPWLQAVASASPPPAPPTRWAAWTEPDRGGGAVVQVGQMGLVSPEPFRRIGHSLVTLLAAWVGGAYARSRSGRETGTPRGSA